MGIIESIRLWVAMRFLPKAKQEFKIEPVITPETESFVERCMQIYKGNPSWLDKDKDIRTVNFAKSICSEVARLTTLDISVTFEDGGRGTWLQEQIDKVKPRLRHWVEYSCGFGTVILKPSIDKVEVVPPNRFIVTESNNGDITGVVFHDQIRSEDGKVYYNRLEYHRFINDVNGVKRYAVDNRTFIGNSADDTGRAVPIESTPWAGLAESAIFTDVEQPLFGVMRTPQANNLELNSPLGFPIFSDAIEELKDLDVAYSKNAIEIMDSEKIVLLDSDRMLTGGESIKNRDMAKMREKLDLPRYVRNVTGDGASTFYQEIIPTLNTATRIDGINALLSQIGYKCGFSNGYFVFNEKTGLATATQIEAEQQRTVQFIKDMRDKLECAIDGLIYALDKFATLYGLAPNGEYEYVYDFKDITYNYEEDRANWWKYVTQNKIPAWIYFVKFEGMTEEDARALIAEAKADEPQGLFDE